MLEAETGKKPRIWWRYNLCSWMLAKRTGRQLASRRVNHVLCSAVKPGLLQCRNPIPESAINVVEYTACGSRVVDDIGRAVVHVAEGYSSGSSTSHP